MPKLAIAELHRILALCHQQPSLIPMTHLYNESWLLTIALSAESRGVRCLPFEIAKDAQACCEGLLSSPFAPRRKGDNLGEGTTNADGVIGHWALRQGTVRGLELAPNGSQLVVIEAKMFSKISAGTRRVKWFDQVARSIACMARLLAQAETPVDRYKSLAFYLFSPQDHLATHRPLVNAQSVRQKIQQRVNGYGEDAAPLEA